MAGKNTARVVKAVQISILSLAILFATACAGKKYVPNQTSEILGGVVTMNAEWVQDKGKKYDIRLAVTNEHKYPIIILLGETKCYRGNTRGELKHTFFNTGERTIDFKVGERKSFNMVCKYGFKQKGDFKITLGRIHSNPSGDGKTLGAVLATDLEWTMKDIRK